MTDNLTPAEIALAHDLEKKLNKAKAKIASLRSKNKWLLTIFDTICNQLNCQRDSDAAFHALSNLESTIISLRERLGKAEGEAHRKSIDIIGWTEIAGRHLCRAEAAEAREAELVVALKDLLDAVKPLNDIPPSVQSQQNLRIVNSAHKVVNLVSNVP